VVPRAGMDFWRTEKSFASPGIRARAPDRPARRLFAIRLRYSGFCEKNVEIHNVKAGSMHSIHCV